MADIFCRVHQSFLELDSIPATRVHGCTRKAGQHRKCFPAGAENCYIIYFKFLEALLYGCTNICHRGTSPSWQSKLYKDNLPSNKTNFRKHYEPTQKFCSGRSVSLLSLPAAPGAFLQSRCLFPKACGYVLSIKKAETVMVPARVSMYHFKSRSNQRHVSPGKRSYPLFCRGQNR